MAKGVEKTEEMVEGVEMVTEGQHREVGGILEVIGKLGARAQEAVFLMVTLGAGSGEAVSTSLTCIGL